MFKNIYEITKETCALVQIGNAKTKILEKKVEREINTSIKEILNYSCNYYGSSYQGRKEASKKILGSQYKIPIMIEESNEIIFFPTSSPENSNCIWISLKNLIDYKKYGNKVVVYLKDNNIINIDISYESFENQVMRATKLMLILKNRKN